MSVNKRYTNALLYSLDPMESIYSPSDSLGSRILKQVLWHPSTGGLNVFNCTFAYVLLLLPTDVLQVRDFDHILVKFLAVVRFPSEFLAEAPEKLLSGLSLLSIHIEPTVREWTWTALVQFKKMKLGLESATKHVFPTIKLLLSISAVESSRYNLATERQCRFRLLAELLSMLDPVALKVAAGRYLDVGAFRDSLVDTILASSSNEFWALLRIGMHLLSAELLDTAKWTQSFGKIIRHKTFHASCISDARTDGDTPQKFSWIRSLLKDPKNHWILREIKVELALYSPRNKDAIGHLLLDIATHASKMPVPDAVFFDQLALYLIQIFSSEIPPPSQAIRFISERFSANVQTLYTGFVSNQDPPVDLTPLWKSVTLNRVSHHFKFIALHAFGEVASVGLAETSPATRTSFTEIEKIVLSLLKSLKSASTSVKQSLLNHLQDVIVSILMASNQSIYNALYELIRESSNFSTYAYYKMTFVFRYSSYNMSAVPRTFFWVWPKLTQKAFQKVRRILCQNLYLCRVACIACNQT